MRLPQFSRCPLRSQISERRVTLAQTNSKACPKILFYPLFAIGIATLLLQFYNIAVLNRFWPFFAGIFLHLMAAMLQFVRLVLLGSP